jgi:hypothetical protein
LDYLTPEVGVLNQSGGKRPRGLPPNAWVGAPDIKLEVFIEITHPMCAGYSEAKSKKCFFEGFFFLEKFGCVDFFGLCRP